MNRYQRDAAIVDAVLEAVGDVPLHQAAQLLHQLADSLLAPGPQVLPERGSCPSEMAYKRHRAAGERCDRCAAYRAAAERHAYRKHPEWRENARRRARERKAAA